MRGFGTSLVPDLFAPREQPIDRRTRQFLHQHLGLQCPRCGLALSVDEHILIPGPGSNWAVGCTKPFMHGIAYGDHSWRISEAEARQLASLAVGNAGARRELVKRVKQIVKGKTSSEELVARLKAR